MRSKHTEEQLAWLKNHLPKYEQKTSGATRGDAKKFALDCAATYIQLWGLPKTGNGEEEKESVVKEQIYTWFKNSCARGKDARMKHQQKKNAQAAIGGQLDPRQHSPHHPGHHPHHPAHGHPGHPHHPAHGHPGHGYALHPHHPPPQHLPYPGPGPAHPPRPPHPSLHHDDLRRRERDSLTLPPIHAYHQHPRPPSPGSSNSSARGSPVLRPVYSHSHHPTHAPRHPHHLPPTSNLRSTHALSIDTLPPPPPPPPAAQHLQQDLPAKLLALAAGRSSTKLVDVAADVLSTWSSAARVVDALFAAAGETAHPSSSSSASSSTSSAGAPTMMKGMLPTPVSVGSASPVRQRDRERSHPSPSASASASRPRSRSRSRSASAAMDVDRPDQREEYDDDADAEGEPEPSPSAEPHEVGGVPLAVTSASRSPSTHARTRTRSPSLPPPPTLAELLRAFSQLLAGLPHHEAGAIRAALHCSLRRPPPLPSATSASTGVQDFRERAELVRRQRRAHVLWARVLATCLSERVLSSGQEGQGEEEREWRWFVRGCVRDALVSEDEEAGWLAGAYLLRALGGGGAGGEEDARLVRAYEGRWRDVRDERRQSEMGDVMLDLRRASSGSA